MKATPRRLMLVDDDSMDRRAVTRLLDPRYTVAEASTADDAIERSRSFQADCIIVDYRLPDMDGIELVRELVPSGAAIVMLTGGGDETVAVEAMKAGALDYVKKDQIDAIRLETAITKACERSRLERQLEETRKELEDFAAIAAHDLKSPLATIVGFLKIVSDSPLSVLPEQEKEFVDRSASLAESLIDMIDQLISYTKTGRTSASFDRVDLGSVVSRAVDRVQDAIDRSNASIEVGELPFVQGIENDLVQLVQNLVANAIKFRGESSPRVRVTASLSDGRDWVVSVEDNGIGIAEQDREKVFAPLSRLHTEAEFAGHGLGLATCRKIVRHHGGRIWVEAAESGGSLFRFTLPNAGGDEAVG